MMKLLLVVLLTLPVIANAQNVIDWDPNYKLNISDFQSGATAIGEGAGNIYSLHSSARMDFSFSMSNYEFMFTKNFNSKVNCTFTRDAASLIAPDEKIAECLLRFARYEFDLSELYARKFRKKLFESKGAFSSASFFRPIFDELQKEYVDRHGNAAKETDIGRNEAKLAELHFEVLGEIDELVEFCKTCKPPKRRKKS
ncbi:MAG: hypothetical protein WD824_12575 [Cyclobacteriaceae bacterium]